MDFCSVLALHPPTADLVLRGELDAFAAAELRLRLDDAVDRGCVSFDIDASEVTFLDAGGVGTLVRLVNTVAPFGGTVTVLAASTRFRHVAEITGTGAAFGLDLLPVHRRTAPAPSLLTIGQGGRSSHAASARSSLPAGTQHRRTLATTRGVSRSDDNGEVRGGWPSTPSRGPVPRGRPRHHP